MEKRFIPYEQALALRDLGFDEPCFGISNSSEKIHITYEFDCKFNNKLANQNSDFKNSAYEDYIAIPTYQETFDFFREKHDLDIIERPHIGKTKKYVCDPINRRLEAKDTFIEARLECLKKLIEIVKNG